MRRRCSLSLEGFRLPMIALYNDATDEKIPIT